ncbi:CDGSH iron-sulfur domain-containing protein, partial [Micromonospora fluostatini]
MEHTGSEPNVVITPYPDGPLLVRGAFLLRAPDGTPIEPGRSTIA